MQARIVVKLFAAYSESEAAGSKFENPDADDHLRAWDWDAAARLALERYEMLGISRLPLSVMLTPYRHRPDDYFNPHTGHY